MALEIKLDLRLSQQLIMTPQLQQAIKLLQLSRLELQEVIAQEIEENPVLEDDGNLEEKEQLETSSETPDQDEDFDWKEYMESHSISTYTPPRAAENETPWENFLTRKETLSDHLLWQLKMSPLTPPEEEIGAFTIGNVDEDGYLQVSVEEVSQQLHVPVKAAEEVLNTIQSFDPPGVGARELQECLLIQLRGLAERDPLAEEIVENHLSYCKNRDYRRLAKKLKAPLPQVLEAIKTISHLEPKPGRPFSTEEAMIIIPDVFVYKTEGEYMIVLNEDSLPKLRISSYYRHLLEAESDDVPRDYLKEKLKSALWFIKSIQQRQETLYKVTKSIVKFQMDFLDKGIDYLRPLVLKEVANDIQMHESTVSRVTTNKYMHTPQGIYELKFFFGGKIGEGKEEVAAKRVQNLIKQIIAEEDSRRPFSDEKIVNLLKERYNITIARRTVAKYREMMKILSSNERKRVL